MEKRCNRCRKPLPFHCFYKDKRKKDGLTLYCKECCKNASAKWQKANPERHRLSESNRRKTPKGHLSSLISRGIRKSLRGNKVGKHWEEVVGYTLNNLKKNLEKKFLPRMSWKNYGQWHIDHIIPISAFNFETPGHIDFKRCWSLQNLRPLWARENLSKINKLNVPFQPSLKIEI